jgi:RNA polymerase sigma factor (sigma-70 family)
VKEQKGKEQGAGMEPSFSEEEDRRDAQLEAIFRTHVADLYRYIYRQVRHAVIAEDLTSAVFLKALRWLQQDRSPESVKGWLYATARSIMADYWHEHAKMQLLPLEAMEEMPMLSEESDEQMRPLQARIQRLLEGLPYLLVAILREGQGIAAQLLQISGVRLEQVGETVHISVIPETEEGPITLPTDFQEALQQHRPYLRSCLTPRKRGLSTGLSKPKEEPREASKWKKPSSSFNGSIKRTSSSVNAIHPFCEQI